MNLGVPSAACAVRRQIDAAVWVCDVVTGLCCASPLMCPSGCLRWEDAVCTCTGSEETSCVCRGTDARAYLMWGTQNPDSSRSARSQGRPRKRLSRPNLSTACHEAVAYERIEIDAHALRGLASPSWPARAQSRPRTRTASFALPCFAARPSVLPRRARCCLADVLRERASQGPRWDGALFDILLRRGDQASSGPDAVLTSADAAWTCLSYSRNLLS